MPAGQERTLRRRIRSIQSTQKITRAMELIAASRIVRAQLAITAAKPYAERMNDVVSEIAAAPEAKDHWVFAGGGERPLVVVLAADRGLSGAFNISVLRAADELLRRLSRRAGPPALVAVGRKAVGYFRFNGRAMADSFEGLSDRPRFEDAQKVVAGVAHELETGSIGEIYLVSTRFSSVGSQKVETRRLVPLDRPERKGSTVFEFEPDPAQILDRLLPRWLEAEVYLALLESAASFHVAQQRAMKAATDNADELIKTLRRAMNRARQDSITTEIMEIVSGAEALRQTGRGDEIAGRPDIYVFPEAS
ncbi:MAG: ATP synthase F1 subunit gamma [Acidimicrobiales bacterium]